jgi:4-hydroxy-3-methylbut-2-enyl diphosphate reductase
VTEELVVLAPLRIEAALLGRAGRVRRTGMGPARARRAAEAVGAEPARAVAVAGFCGALDPGLAPGDLVVATEVRGDGPPRPCPAAPLLAAELRRAGLRVHLGPILSTARIVRGGERRRARATGAIAVDTESAWLAAAAGGRPLAVVRAVVDAPGRELLRPGAGLDALRAARSLWRAAPVLARFGRAAAPRRVLLAAPRSFCAGVERAIEIVERALEEHGPPVYVRKQIVHNVHVVRDLERRGAVFVDELASVPPGAVVVFSAHGVSPAVRREAAARGLRVIDATCPLVAKVHAEARRFARAGYTIFLIGHEGHEEVEGTSGEAPEAIRLIDADEGVPEALEVPDPRRVAFLSQTTLAVEDVGQVVEELRRRFPELSGPGSDDICYATQNRQDAVREIAPACDLLLVVGSDNSSNSNRLVEVAERAGCPARLIDDEEGIELAWLEGARTVGLTAGASAPERLVDRVLAALGGLGDVRVEERVVAREAVRFTLPVEVRGG